MTAVVPAPGSRPAPERRPEHRRGSHLRPVDRPRPKRSPAVPALVGVGIVITALLGLAVMHALLIGGQVRLDAMRSDVASESEAIRRLELRVAELESPDRVLDVARDRLGMVQPTEVGYLLPASVEIPGAEPVRVEAATAPVPDPVAEVTSDEQAEVDDVVEADADTDAATDTDTDASAASDEPTDPEPSDGGRDE